MDKYVKLIEGDRWGRDGWRIRCGEIKPCPDAILQQSGGHLQVVSRPRVLRSIVKPSAISSRYKRTTKKEKNIDTEDE